MGIPVDISIHAPLAGRDQFVFSGIWRGRISIHAPLAGRDSSGPAPRRRAPDFNPRAPCGARRSRPRTAMALTGFQSTRPLRGATAVLTGINQASLFQSTRPLRGATSFRCSYCRTHCISIHAPLAGRDTCAVAEAWQTNISIHAPLAGRDRAFTFGFGCNIDFNPRAPCGARPPLLRRGPPSSPFQSTRPLRGATPDDGIPAVLQRISIHAPLAGRDSYLSACYHGWDISIHAPLAGRDIACSRTPLAR